MGCSIKAIHDDEDDYLELCSRYGVSPKRDASGFVDCYGIHANLLKRKNRGEDVDISDAAVLEEERKRRRGSLIYKIEEAEIKLAELRAQLEKELS